MRTTNNEVRREWTPVGFFYFQTQGIVTSVKLNEQQAQSATTANLYRRFAMIQALFQSLNLAVAGCTGLSDKCR